MLIHCRFQANIFFLPDRLFPNFWASNFVLRRSRNSQNYTIWSRGWKGPVGLAARDWEISLNLIIYHHLFQARLRASSPEGEMSPPSYQCAALLPRRTSPARRSPNSLQQQPGRAELYRCHLPRWDPESRPRAAATLSGPLPLSISGPEQQQLHGHWYHHHNDGRSKGASEAEEDEQLSRDFLQSGQEDELSISQGKQRSTRRGRGRRRRRRLHRRKPRQVNRELCSHDWASGRQPSAGPVFPRRHSRWQKSPASAWDQNDGLQIGGGFVWNRQSMLGSWYGQQQLHWQSLERRLWRQTARWRFEERGRDGSRTSQRVSSAAKWKGKQ